jgi:diaminopimelate epimerase
MQFTRMHGCGNDYVFVDCRADPPLAARFCADSAYASDTARRIADRHRGVGGDGLILLLPDETSHVRMIMFNADGSRGAMCGNGLRCLARLALESVLPAGERLTDWSPLPSSSAAWAAGAGRCLPDRIRRALWAALTQAQAGTRVRLASVTVATDAGPHPVFAALTEDPGPSMLAVAMGHVRVEPAFEQPDLIQPGLVASVIPVQVGSAHAVVEVPEAKPVDLRAVGTVLQALPRFAGGVNVHLVERVAADVLFMRPWERGSGATLACGTGACAAVAALHDCRGLAADWRVDQPGGTVWVQSGDPLLMTGPAEYICRGSWSGS